jgi:hypothetical protein
MRHKSKGKGEERDKGKATDARPAISHKLKQYCLDNKVCIAFQNGDCVRGDKCAYAHDKAPSTVMICSRSQPSGGDGDVFSTHSTWVIDSGTSIDATGGTTGVMKQVEGLGLLHTAGGTVAPDQVIDTTLDELGESISALHLQGSPNAIALGKRCAEN